MFYLDKRDRAVWRTWKRSRRSKDAKHDREVKVIDLLTVNRGLEDNYRTNELQH